jgi:hypothetical protein
VLGQRDHLGGVFGFAQLFVNLGEQVPAARDLRGEPDDCASATARGRSPSSRAHVLQPTDAEVILEVQGISPRASRSGWRRIGERLPWAFAKMRMQLAGRGVAHAELVVAAERGVVRHVGRAGSARVRLFLKEHGNLKAARRLRGSDV